MLRVDSRLTYRVSTLPSYKQGEWKPREINNPAYKGKWIHPEIDNPEYTADSEIYKYDSIGVIGLDLWQVRLFFCTAKRQEQK